MHDRNCCNLAAQYRKTIIMTAIIINNNQLPVQTVAPTNLVIGEVQLSADRKTTNKLQPLADSERIRRIVLPANHWSGFYAADEKGSKSQELTDVLKSALIKIASDKLRDTLAENPMAKVVNASDYTISAILVWSAETASSRGSITFTRDDVETWFDSSATAAAIKARQEAAGKTATAIATLMTFARNRFAALAAKNHGLKDAADADKLLALIDTADTSTALVTDLAGRIAHISKSLAAKAAEATVSMDDL